MRPVETVVYPSRLEDSWATATVQSVVGVLESCLVDRAKRRRGRASQPRTPCLRRNDDDDVAVGGIWLERHETRIVNRTPVSPSEASCMSTAVGVNTDVVLIPWIPSWTVTGESVGKTAYEPRLKATATRNNASATTYFVTKPRFCVVLDPPSLSASSAPDGNSVTPAPDPQPGPPRHLINQAIQGRTVYNCGEAGGVCDGVDDNHDEDRSTRPREPAYTDRDPMYRAPSPRTGRTRSWPRVPATAS